MAISVQGIFSAWQIFEATLAHFYAIGRIFILHNSQILLTTILSPGHTVDPLYTTYSVGQKLNPNFL